MPQLCKNCKHFHQILKKYGYGTFLGSGKTKNDHTLIAGADDHIDSSLQRKSIEPIGNIGLRQTFFFDLVSFYLPILLRIGRITAVVLVTCRWNLVW